MPVSFEHMRRALRSLEDALSPAPRNDRERDGAIQRFEYTFEITWKVAARVLAEAGVTAQSPKAVIRELAVQGWIGDAEQWLVFLAARNRTSHIYNEAVAREVFEQARRFAEQCSKLLTTLQAASR